MDWRDAEREYDDEVIGETTLGRLFEDTAARHPNRPAQRYKGGVYDRSLTESVLPAAPPGEFRGLSYTEMRDVVRRLAAGFHDLGIDAGDRVGIFADTRMEWAQCDFALLSVGAVVTTVYRDSSPSQVAYLLGDSDASAVVVENEELLERVRSVEDDLDIDVVVSMDRLEAGAQETDVGPTVVTLADVYARGAETFDPDAHQERVDAPAMDDLASLLYTSGTTGQPKGVELTHRNFRANVNQVRKRTAPRPEKADHLPSITERTQTVSYLPLAHVFERLGGHFLMFASGACVAYAESPDTLKADFGAIGPTVATSVPRVYEKIYDTIREQASESGVKRRIFEWATDVGVDHQEADSPGSLLNAKQALADQLVFSTVRDALGGNVEMLISGGGSLSAELCTLYHAMGLPIYEGYGLTETAPVVTVNPPEAPKVGTIGPPLPDVELHVDESAVNQDAFDDPGEVGELFVRGPNVTDGYWNKPEETAAAFTEVVVADGGSGESGVGGGGTEAGGGPSVSSTTGSPDRWFRTGDIVHRRPDGYLEFRERAKQILVLSTGKNVAPGPIEDAFAASEVVEQCMVVGDGEKFVGALVVPNLDHVEKWADEAGVDLPDDPESICADDRVVAYVENEVDRINEQFERHETIKEFRLVPREFTEENGMLTPTMKKKRRVIEAEFDGLIGEMYAE